MKKSAIPFKKIYQKLFSHFGSQHWWPGDTPFEIIVGAILTQNTNWGNVEKAIVNLKKAKVLNPKALHQTTLAKLARVVKPSGFFNVKARRIKNFLDFFFVEYNGRISLMAKESTEILRKKILSVNGIGPETADSILLYAFDKPVFVVDAYTKRMLIRHKWIKSQADYHLIQKLFMEKLACEARLFNEYHALIVRLGKEYCRPKARCEICPLKQFLR